jgi:deferrochelatase/peroxidase EfeB
MAAQTVRRWWARVAAVAVGIGLATAPAAPALAHEVGGVGATNFVTTLSAVAPTVPGVDLRVIENGSRLELRNATGTDVVVAGYGGEPYARIGPDGVALNDNSPATYINADRFSTAPVPATADGKGPPVWRAVSTEPVWRWHDHRVHWMLSALPPVVAADPGVPHQISSWTVVLLYGDDLAGAERLTATGTLSWQPGPSPLPWLGLALLVAVAVAAVTQLARPHRFLAAATGLLLLADLAHGFGAMLVTQGSVPERLSALLGSEALLIWPFTLLACWLLWHRHTRAAWLGAGLGVLVAVTMVLDDAPVWWRSSAPTALPADVNRAAVAIVAGLGLGLIVALPLLLRRHPVTDRPWSAFEPGTQRPVPPQPEPSPSAAETDPVPSGETDPAPSGETDPEPFGETDPEPFGETDPEPSGETDPEPAGIGRRQVTGLFAAGALGALAGGTIGATAASRSGGVPTPTGVPLTDVGARSIPFRGTRQAGIVAPARPQAHAWVAGFDLVPGTTLDRLRELLRRWSAAADRLTAGQPAGGPDDAVVAGLGAAALTVTIGFGPSLFGRAGVAAGVRPDALAPLPAFDGERLDPARGDGDIGLVVAADDPLVVSHAARVLTRLAAGTAGPRWAMSGFNAARGSGPDGATPRNLMGQVDGTNNPRPTDPDFDAKVFVAANAEPAWLRGGSYLVVRRIRMLLDDWDTVDTAIQERVIGRRRDTGAPLTGGEERSAADLGARAADGSLVIPENAHMRLAAPAANEGAAMLRRGFSYVDGDERGLLFLAWQADPRHGFIPVQRRLVAADALGRFIRHETSALFAVPGGVGRDGYLGQSLLESL